VNTTFEFQRPQFAMIEDSFFLNHRTQHQLKFSAELDGG
jgi:hypothetical protein